MLSSRVAQCHFPFQRLSSINKLNLPRVPETHSHAIRTSFPWIGSGVAFLISSASSCSGVVVLLLLVREGKVRRRAYFSDLFLGLEAPGWCDVEAVELAMQVGESALVMCS